LSKAIADQDEAHEREERHQSFVWAFADARDHRGTLSAHGHEDMRTDEDNQSEHEDSKAHGSSASASERE
jgi:hypothetical protein